MGLAVQHSTQHTTSAYLFKFSHVFMSLGWTDEASVFAMGAGNVGGNSNG
jgi:hypothetical protein